MRKGLRGQKKTVPPLASEICGELAKKNRAKSTVIAALVFAELATLSILCHEVHDMKKLKKVAFAYQAGR